MGRTPGQEDGLPNASARLEKRVAPNHPPPICLSAKARLQGGELVGLRRLPGGGATLPGDERHTLGPEIAEIGGGEVVQWCAGGVFSCKMSAAAATTTTAAAATTNYPTIQRGSLVRRHDGSPGSINPWSIGPQTNLEVDPSLGGGSFGCFLVVSLARAQLVRANLGR